MQDKSNCSRFTIVAQFAIIRNTVAKNFYGVVNIVEQKFLDKLFKLKNNFSVKIIIGIRGTGKSTLLKAFADELKTRGVSDKEIIFVKCTATERLNNFQQLYKLVEEQTAGLEKFFLLVDDIDCVADAEKAINALFVGAPAEIYVTSSSDTLAEKISMLLPENCDVLKLYPPSFSNYAKNFPAEDAETLLQRYLHFGALPDTIGADEKFLPTILRGLAYEVLFDIAAKNSLQKANIFQLMIKFLARKTGRSINPNHLADYVTSLGCVVHKNSIRAYLKFVDEFFVKIPRHDIKSGKFIQSGEKFYCIDNGLLCTLRDFDSTDETTLIENAVCLELLRRGYKVSCGLLGTMTINFVATRGDKKIFIQVLPADGNVTVRRITRPLRALPADAEKLLISMKPEKTFDNVKNVTLKDFLLNE